MGLDRRACCSLTLALLAGAWTMLVTLMSMLSIPIGKADNADGALNALMMGGWFMPSPSVLWQDTIITDYIDPATGGNYTPVLIPTPNHSPAPRCRPVWPTCRPRWLPSS